MRLSPDFVSTCLLWVDTILRLSHRISTYSNNALNPPRIIASAAYLRGRFSVAGVGVESAVSPCPNSARCCLLNYLSTADDIIRKITEHVRGARTPPATRSATAPPNHPVRDHWATDMALFMSTLVQSLQLYPHHQ